MGDRSRVRGKEEWVGEADCGCHHWPPCVSYSYIWQHIEIGYVQGLCDLLAPLLVILDDGECTLPAPALGMQFPSHGREERLTLLCDSTDSVGAAVQKTYLVNTSRS